MSEFQTRNAIRFHWLKKPGVKENAYLMVGIKGGLYFLIRIKK